MKKILRVALAGALSVTLVASPVRACCDDFWSCAGAVASGGLTCAVEAAVNVLKDALASATHERDTTRDAFEQGLTASVNEARSTLDGWKRSADDAAADAKRSAESAAKLVGDENTRLKNLTASGLRTLGSTAPTPTPRPPGGSRLQGSSAALHAQSLALLQDVSLEDIKRRIEAEQRAAEGSQKASALQAQKAGQAMEESERISRELFAVSFLAGMASLIVLLQDGISNPVKAIAAVPLVLNALVAVENALARDVLPVLEAETKKRTDLADAPHASADDAEAHAKRARDLLAKLRRAVLLQTATERQALAKEPLTGPTPAPRPRLALASGAAFSKFSRSLPGRADALRSSLLLARAAGPPDVSPFRTKVTADLSGQFRGKGPAEAARIRDGLLAEARRRFASDPKTLAGVEKLIADASKVRF